MRLHDLLVDLPVTAVAGPADAEISSLAYDSRAVRPGCLFVAINGFHTDGHAFIPQAIERGAAAIVYQDELPASVMATTDHRPSTIDSEAVIPQLPTPNSQLPTTDDKRPALLGCGCLIRAPRSRR